MDMAVKIFIIGLQTVNVLCKAGCIVVTEEKNRTMIEDMHMDWAPDVNTALAMATQVLGKMSTVSVVPDGVGVIVEP